MDRNAKGRFYYQLILKKHVPKQKESKKEEEIRIPIPNTRFLYTGIKQTDNSWTNGILDPATGERRTCSGPNLPNAGMLIMISMLTNKIFTNNKKLSSIKGTSKQIIKIIKKAKQTYEHKHKHLKRPRRINRKSKSSQTNRAKRLKNGVNKPNPRRNKQPGKRSKRN